MIRALRQNARWSAGFSLVELAVYIVVLGIISTVVTTVVLSLFRSEQTVSDISSASNDSQIISTVLTNDIRNARAVKVDGNQVFLSVAGSDPGAVSWSCVRWAVSATSGALVRYEVAEPVSQPVSWGAGRAMATDLSRIDGRPYFSGGGTAAAAGNATGTVTYSLGLRSASNGILPVAGQASNRLASTGSTCW